MKLRELNCFNEIIIQAHDNPDADSIASGFGLYWFFRKTGKQVRFIYGGNNSVRKSNLVMMLDTLSIPMEHVTELEHSPELLITVDCQYGERNVQKFPAQHIAVIDHHPSVTSVPSGYSEIRDRYGSCSTLVWDLLTEEGYDPGRDEYLATALYYGLYMDTGRLQELGHPKDRDMRDSLEFRCRRGDLLQLINKNITFDEFCLAGRAMEDAVHDAGNGCLLVEAGACDPNLLGVISDAGCPAVADPGADLVAIAQRRGYKVIPLVGPSSILMSLMASGFNGQRFAFEGYLPVDGQARQARLQEMTRRIERERQTQIFIEAPYRNNQLIADLVKHLPAGMRLCVASDITGERQEIITRTLGEWKRAQYDYHKIPTIFLLYQ